MGKNFKRCLFFKLSKSQNENVVNLKYSSKQRYSVIHTRYFLSTLLRKGIFVAIIFSFLNEDGLFYHSDQNELSRKRETDLRAAAKAAIRFRGIRPHAAAMRFNDCARKVKPQPGAFRLLDGIG